MPITAVPRSGLRAAMTAPVPAMASIEAKKIVPAWPCRRPPLRTESAAPPARSAALPAATWKSVRPSITLSLANLRIGVLHRQHTLDMIREDKGMIAGCIDKMRRDACGGCERRDACAELFPFLFKARSKPAPRAGEGVANPFFSFLGEVAKAFEAKAEQKAPLRPSPFRAEVEKRLEPLLASGEVGIERLARDLGYSRQTLYRRLKAEGITYEQL